MTCNKAGHKAQYYLSCDANGVLSVGPTADFIGSGEVSLPDCSNWDAATKTPICDRTALGIYSIDQTPCRKDNCFRFCEGDNSKTAKKIKERFISDILTLLFTLGPNGYIQYISKFYIDKTNLSVTATGLRIHASISTSQKEAMVSLILILQQKRVSKLVAVMNLEPLKLLLIRKHQDRNQLVNGLNGLLGVFVRLDVGMVKRLVSVPVQMMTAKDLQLNLLHVIKATV